MMNATRTWTTKKNLSASVELTPQPSAPLHMRWTVVVRVRGGKAAELTASADGAFICTWGHVPAEEHSTVRALIADVGTAAERAYFGAAMV